MDRRCQTLGLKPCAQRAGQVLRHTGARGLGAADDERRCAGPYRSGASQRAGVGQQTLAQHRPRRDVRPRHRRRREECADVLCPPRPTGVVDHHHPDVRRQQVERVGVGELSPGPCRLRVPVRHPSELEEAGHAGVARRMMRERRTLLKKWRDEADEAILCPLHRIAVPAEGHRVEHHDTVGLVHRANDGGLGVVSAADARRLHPAVELALTVRERRRREFERPDVGLADPLQLAREHAGDLLQRWTLLRRRRQDYRRHG